MELKGITLREKFIEYSNLCLSEKYVIDDKMDLLLKTFEENKSGILLCGNPGTGKTMIFEILKNITHPQDKNYFKIKTCTEMVTAFNIEGHEIFRNKSLFDKNILWDDLGMEPVGKFFGDKIEVMQQMIFEGYNKFKYEGILLHFTTMMLPEEIERRYGNWFWSRLSQICTIISIQHNNDYRLRKNFTGYPKVTHLRRYTQEEKEWNKSYAEYKQNPPNTEPYKTLGQRKKEELNVAAKALADVIRQEF